MAEYRENRRLLANELKIVGERLTIKIRIDPHIRELNRGTVRSLERVAFHSFAIPLLDFGREVIRSAESPTGSGPMHNN